MRRIWSFGILLALTGSVLAGSASAAQISPPGTYVYTDILKPHGKARSVAVKAADAKRCDGGNSQVIGSPTFDACMLARGWRMTQFKPAPAPAPQPASAPESNPYGDNNVWVNTRKVARSDAVLRADADYCLRLTGPDPVGQETSPALKQCMLSRGWRFDRTDGSGAFIDPDTGLECRNNGFASICGTPSHPVDYTNRHGLSCHRSGLISVCSNL
jgi:hypothetical protein